MNHTFAILVIVVSVVVVVTFGNHPYCRDVHGQPVDWFAAIKLPNLESSTSDGTAYIYLDANNPEWTYQTGITSKKSAIGETVSQIYGTTESYNDSIAWIVYNDEPTNGHTTGTLGHSKGVVVAGYHSGFWLVHSVPKFPKLPYQSNNEYAYPKSGVKFGQSFLCISMIPVILDKVGDQLINNEVKIYGSHFGGNMKLVYPDLYTSTLPRRHVRGWPKNTHDGVRFQNLQSIRGFRFLSISKNRHFAKDLYEDLIANLAQSNVYTETWLNSRDTFDSFCSSQYKVMNIKSLTMRDIKGLENCSYKSTEDHSKWVITSKSSVHWTCIGDINRGVKQTLRGGGTVCLDSITIWNQYKKLVLDVDNC